MRMLTSAAGRWRGLVVATYVPDAGDVVWLQIDPQAGHKRAGHRPALVLSPARYNDQRGMMVCCPMTSRIKNYVFEVAVTRSPPSVVLADQLKSVNWRARRAIHKGVVAAQVVEEVRAKIKSLLMLQSAVKLPERTGGPGEEPAGPGARPPLARPRLREIDAVWATERTSEHPYDWPRGGDQSAGVFFRKSRR
jgi:mRNA interferase MazF